ncbi:MAG: hypothetical protein A3I75_05095 [Deltaproteobacteria bacterium RIFCSPLOWO2_02_FULL_50_16]|nr:MAG: hypothetical protein A3I75_05095 [Deltaproteobacteria bacterium RIFCSPLOWO2_02_FULL_50_16]
MSHSDILKRIGPVLPGDTIGLAAPGSPFSKRDFLKGVALLKSWGYCPVFQRDIFQSKGYLARSDERRAQELAALFLDPRVKAILFARGGYGMMRLLPLLPWSQIGRSPKVVMGYSDVTPLLNVLWTRYRYPSLHGPMVATDFSQKWATSFKKDFLHFFQDPQRPYFFSDPRLRVLQPGRAKGPLVGGCLSLLVSTLGTPYEIETHGSLLFLEDRGEALYRVDRMLTQLRLAKKLEGVRGILLGSFFSGSQRKDFYRFIKDFFKGFSGPILTEVSTGHCRRARILPIGRMATIESPLKGITIL